MKKLLLVLLAASLASLALLLGAANGPALTRSEAASMIQGKKEKVTCQLSEEVLQKGAQAGYWTWVKETGGVGSPLGEAHTLQLTARGMEVFDGDGRPQRGLFAGYVFLDMRQPLARKVLEVTGITGDEQSKGVEFTWRFDSEKLPDDLRGLLKNPGNSGTAVFRLYDDGWRIVSIDPTGRAIF